MKKIRISPALIAAALAFLGAWGFFWFVYPYHLLRREQMNLFAFDADYISQTYRGSAWLARFAGDFLEQFFLFPGVGALIVALLLTAIGAVVYRICRHFLKEWPSLGIAALFFIWSFLRETGNLYITRYTVVTLAYLSLILLALQCRKVWQKPVAAVLLLALGCWALGMPVHKFYGKAWGVPRLNYDKVIGLDVETSRENWDKVIKMSKRDLRMEESSYCLNLAHAMKGDLGSTMLNYAQNHHRTLLFSVSTENSLFTNSLAGEAWFQLGDMTVAEQSAITSLQASPKHTGARFLVRLARVNLISGEDAAAQKYLSLLGKTLFYRKWALSMMPGDAPEPAGLRSGQPPGPQLPALSRPDGLRPGAVHARLRALHGSGAALSGGHSHLAQPAGDPERIDLRALRHRDGDDQPHGLVLPQPGPLLEHLLGLLYGRINA